jgi:hypothetical protein
MKKQNWVGVDVGSRELVVAVERLSSAAKGYRRPIGRRCGPVSCSVFVMRLFATSTQRSSPPLIYARGRRPSGLPRRSFLAVRNPPTPGPDLAH